MAYHGDYAGAADQRPITADASGELRCDSASNAFQFKWQIPQAEFGCYNSELSSTMAARTRAR
jgi:hypothetical protein